MSTVRRYLVAPALARLVRKERGSARVTEGFFPAQSGRTSFVRVEGTQCHLVLMTSDAFGATSEERTEVPRAHGDALLDVCAGKLVYDRAALSLGAGEALVDRYAAPAGLDLVSVVFETAGEAEGFSPPPWFGPEVTASAAYESPALAVQGAPSTGEVPLSNAALDAVLDLVEHRFAYRYAPARAPAERSSGGERPVGIERPVGTERIAGGDRPAGDEGVMGALRRLAGNVPDAPRPLPPALPPAPAPEPEATAPEAAEPEPPTNARIEDVMESLSQALGAAVQAPPEAGPAETDTFERWSVRPRRAQT